MPSSAFLDTDLVSDIPGRAQHTDANLVNPWGMSAAPGGAWWFSDNGSGKSTLYDGSGNTVPLVVGIPPAPGSTAGTLGTPTGTVYNSSGVAFGGNTFLFDSEDGTISGWNGAANATIEVNNSANPSAANGAVYKGLALGTDSSNRLLLYATNFRAGTVDVFTSSFQATTVSGGFSDPNIPAGYAPFNLENLGGNLYVTYAQQDAAKHDDVAGAGNGYVDVFNTNGVLQHHLVTQGNLNSPWGLALAPAGFGSFAGDLLVGNFGDGRINAYDPSSGAFLGQLDDANGNPITIDGLWGLTFGNGGQAGPTTSLYFTAGLDSESHGLYGSLTVTAGKTSTTMQIAASTSSAVFGQTVTLTATVTPTSGTNQPTGTITFMNGSTVVGTGTLSVNGGLDQASANVTNLTVGSHTQLTASYGGDSNFSGSNTATPASVTVTPASTTTALQASANAVDSGQSVTLTAVVATVAPGSGAPTGTVTFSDGNSVLGTATLGVDSATGKDIATWTGNLTVGTHDELSASYATDGNYGASDSTSSPVSVAVNPVIMLPASPLPADTVGIQYQQTLTASGGTGDITLTVSALSGPTDGLTIPTGGTNSLTINGMPTATGTVQFTVTATDSVGGKLVTNYAFVVHPAVRFESATLPDATIGVSYDGTIAAAGGTGAIQLEVTSISGTDGLSIPTSGTNSLDITGQPTQAGTITFTVTATDSVGASQVGQYSLTIDAISLSPTTLPDGTAGTQYSQTVAALGGVGTLTLAVTKVSGSIAGLNIPLTSANPLTISGMPTGTGTVTFTVTTTDADQNSAAANYSITVHPGNPAAVSFLTDPQQLTAGVTSSTMTVELRDSEDNVTQAGAGGLTLSLHSDSTGGFFLDPNGTPLAVNQVSIPAGASTVSFEYEDLSAGTPTLTVAAGFSITQQETIVAAPAAQLTVQTASQGIAGATLPVTVHAVDAFGNTATSFNGPVDVALLNSPNTGKPLGAASVMLSQGVGTFSTFTLGTPGTETVFAAAMSPLVPVTATVAIATAPTFSVTVTPLAPGSTGVGQSLNVTVTARLGTTIDAGYVGTLHITSSDPQATLPSSVTIAAGAHGTAHFSAVLNSAGPQTITATDATLATARGTSRPLTITSSLPLTIDHFLVTGMPATDVAGVMHPVTITAVNAAGQTVRDYTGTVQLTSGNPTPLSVPFLGTNDGVKQVMLALFTTGVQTLTATDGNNRTGAENGINVVSPARQLVIAVSAPSVTAGNTITVTVTGLVSPHVQDTLFTDALHVTSSDPQADVVPQGIQGGMETFTIKLGTAGTQAITVTDDTRPNINVAATHVTVNPGAATHLSITAAPLFALTGTATHVTVTAEDAFGNRVSGGFTDTVTISGVGASQAYTFVPSVDHGTHQFTIKAAATGTEAVTVADQTTAQVAQASAPVTFVNGPVSLVADPAQAGAQALVVLAPAGSNVLITPTDALGQSLTVSINGATAKGSPFTPTGHVFVYAQSGTVSVKLQAKQQVTIAVPAVVIAGTASAILNAGGSRAPTILVGGAGNDLLTGGTGPTILIGAGGADTLTAGSGDTILVGGSTIYDATVAALAGLLNEWSALQLNFAQRVAAMAAGGSAPTLLTALTVTPDPTSNKLVGGSGNDWFWLDFTATVADHLSGFAPADVVIFE